MNKYFGFLIALIVPLVVVYMSVSFLHWDLSPFDTYNQRAGLLYLSFIGEIISLIIYGSWV